MIGIINYGLGNLNSIQNMIKHVNGECRLINSVTEIGNIQKIILPGVGSFDHGMKGLADGKWIEPLTDLVINKNIPVLGICLGMQLMCISSDEGKLCGLGWIDAIVKKFSFPNELKYKIPHMGWNSVTITKPNPLLSIKDYEQRFYFIHSYYPICKNNVDILGTTNHGYEITIAFSKNNIFGVQFHPEKSHRFGMSLMKKFIEL